MATAFEPSPGGPGSHMTASTARLSASPPSDYFGLPTGSHSGSTALTTPSMSSPGLTKPASFHSLQDIAEAVEANPLGLGPPPVFDAGVDPMYADDDAGDDDDVGDIRRGPSVRSRASEYEASILTHSSNGVGLGIGLGLGPPRSPSSLSGRKSPNRFPSNPERPGSPMRLPPSPHSHSSHRRSPGPPSPRRSPAPPSPRAGSGSPLRLPPASPNLRAPSPLGQAPPTMPEPVPVPGPAPAPRALPLPPVQNARGQVSTPPRAQRMPVPSTAPSRPPLEASPALNRGKGSTKRMVAAWENGQPASQDMTPPQPRALPQPGSAPPLGVKSPTSPSPRKLNPRYLDEKPLPIPTARPIPASKTMPWPPPSSARILPGGLKLPTPLTGNTPKSPPQRPSPSSWSPLQSDKRPINLNGDVNSPKSPTRTGGLGKSAGRSPIKRSPFKEIKNVFNGLRKNKNKEEKHTGWGTAAVGVHADEPRQFMSLDDEAGWFAQPLRHPQPEMPSPCSTDRQMDRMGDVEMGGNMPEPQRPGTLRASPALYLAPVPSTSNRWGSWMTAWASLSAHVLTVTYVPVIGGSPHGSPFGSIPEPRANSRPDEELQMRDCVEVRSLRPAEVRGRGVPQAPEGAGSEVLELVFAQGMKRYLAVEGVAGRLGWVSAIWDVLLACKQEPGASTSLPPPSPSLQSLHRFRDLQEQPVYKVGDTWVARSDYRFSFSSAGNTPETEHVPVLPSPPVAKASPLGTTKTGVRPPEPGEVVNVQPGHVVSVPDAAAAIEQLKDDSDSDVPPPLPPKQRARSTLIEERMRTFDAANTPDKGSLPWPVPQMPQTEPVHRTAPLRIRRRDVSETDKGDAEGDATVDAPGVITKASSSTTSSSTPLRESAVRSLDATATGGGAPAPSRVRSSAMDARIRAWQPDPVDTPPPLSRAASERSHATAFSFDPSDLNPSRSASQVRPRADGSTHGHGDIDLGAVDAGLQRTLPVVPENKAAPRTGGLAGPRSPPRARKAVLAEADKTAALVAPKTAPRATVPKTEARPITPADALRTSPKAATTPRRMNTRMLAAAAVFEPTIADRLSNSGSQSPAVMPKSPSLKAPVARATPSVGMLESLTVAARSELSDATSTQPASSVSKPAASTRPSSGPTTIAMPRTAALKTSPKMSSPTTPRRTLFVTNPEPEADLKPAPLSDVSTSRVEAAKAALFKSPPSDTPKSSMASTALSPDTLTVPALSRHFTTTSKVDDAKDDGSVMSRYTTERESIGGVLDDYAPTPSTQARSTLSAQPVEPELVQEAPLGTRGLEPQADFSTISAQVELSTLSRAAGALSPASTGTDPTVLARLDMTSNELTRRLDDVQTGVNMLSGSVGTMSALVHAREERDAALVLPERLDALNDGLQSIHGCVATLPPDLNEKLNALGTDLRGVQMVLYESSAQIAAMAAKDAAEGQPQVEEKELPPPPASPAPEPQLPEIHAKLDALATLIQEVLSRQADLAATTAGLSAAGAAAGVAAGSGEPDASAVPKDLPKETAQDLSREAPKGDAEVVPPAVAPVDAATAAQLAEVQGMVTKLAEERATQTQQTADIAKYLSELNTWLEKFVNNSGSELEGMNRRLDGMLATGEEGQTGAIADLHRKLDEQAAQQADASGQAPVGEGGVQAARLDALVAMMGDERERAAHQNGVMENVLAVLDKQRQDNENLLRAVATDLSTEIRGERVRFIEAMREATTMNMQIHVDEFKKALTNEVSQSMRELGTLREQKKALEHQIADLFTLIAKHGEGGKLLIPSTPSPGPTTTPEARTPRALPLPPH